ncbi:MAG: hypothetical protein HS129_15135 [Leptospiraceae bacterium]|nr:hypothetical protein [Leptospiraceae bacterium]NUM41339.1 hypothetical protein [Leptospiraceae bacterium]
MKISIALFFALVLGCASTNVRNVDLGKTTAERIEAVKSGAINKLPDSTEKKWILSELDSCKSTILEQGKNSASIQKENQTLRDKLQTCSDEKAEYANKSANMVIFLVVSVVIILVLIILMILVRQGVLKTIFGVGKLPVEGV